jgi:hypothetical protein
MVTAEERLAIAADRRLWVAEVGFRAGLAQSEPRELCIGCGFKIRGPNHKSGTHHKIRHPKLRKDSK